MPPRVDGQWRGCLYIAVAYAAISVGLFWISRWWTWLVLAAPVGIGLAIAGITALRRFVVLAQSRAVFERRGVRFLVVYSRSPNWETHIRDNWLNRFGPSAVTLNWSERAEWRSSLEVRLFNNFIRASHNFNPAVLVLRGFRRPLVYRFFYAFHEAKGGRPEYLKELETELFEHLPDDRRTARTTGAP
jgi:hypothetical protein